jgi:hypothetical protein
MTGGRPITPGTPHDPRFVTGLSFNMLLANWLTFNSLSQLLAVNLPFGLKSHKHNIQRLEPKQAVKEQ